MEKRSFTAADLDVLRQWDTPTICNGLGVDRTRSAARSALPWNRWLRRIASCRRLSVWQRTGLIRAKEPPHGPIPSREDWYDYVGCRRHVYDRGSPGHRQSARLRRGRALGAKFSLTVHLALGVLGCVTNGSFRDLDMLAPGFQIIGGRIGPSHAHVHLVQMRCEVNIFGMLASARRRHSR